MLVLYLLSTILVSNVLLQRRAEAAASLVRITTIPRQGPFRVRQRVQFSCMVDPVQSSPLTYQWRNVKSLHGSSSYYGGSFNTTFNKYTLRYCLYSCTVTLNNTLLGSADRFIEVHGLLHTDDSITRAFSLHGRMAMRIQVGGYNYYNYIHSLAWYHNGTHVTSSSRVHIVDNGTALTISNMVPSDAGKYEVKINSIESFGESSLTCDINIRPMFEGHARFAPVTFIVHESSVPSYKPAQDVIMDHYIPTYRGTSVKSITIDNVIKINTIAVLVNGFHVDALLYKDNNRIYDKNIFNRRVSYGDEIMQSLRISYNNSDDVTGIYVYVAGIHIWDINRRTCLHYYNLRSYWFRFPIFILYWNIKIYNTPILHLRLEKMVLTSEEMNAIECNVINGQPTDLSLWNNNMVLAQTHGTSLRHQTTSLFGVFRCQADNVSNSSLVLERAPLQLILEDTDLGCCITTMQLQISLAQLLSTLCNACNISSQSLEETSLKLSTSGRSVYFATDLVHSNSEGTITSSSLISMLLSWLLSQEEPTLNVAGQYVALSKMCPIPGNTFTSQICLDQLNDQATAYASTSLNDQADNSTSGVNIATSFIMGILIGVLAATTFLLLLFCCIRKRHQNAPRVNVNGNVEEDKSRDISTDINQAYETVDVHYIIPAEVGQAGSERAEPIYEHPL